jgi:hypothetical protein
MGKRQLLFVTYRDENLEEGVSYAIELAKTMFEDITLLLVRKKSNLIDKLGNLMTAVNFAEGDDHGAGQEIMSGDSVDAEDQCEKILARLMAKCRKEGIQVDVEETDLDAISGIRTFLKEVFRNRQGRPEPGRDRQRQHLSQGSEPTRADGVPADCNHDPAGLRRGMLKDSISACVRKQTVQR